MVKAVSVPYLAKLTDTCTCNKSYKMLHKDILSLLSVTWEGLVNSIFTCYTLAEDLNNFRLYGSAASHSEMKLAAAKYMA